MPTTAITCHSVDEALSHALDTLIARVRAGHDVADAYHRLAPDVLAHAADIAVMDYRTDHALLDDGTVVVFDRDLVRPSHSLRLRAVLGVKVRLRDLPTVCSRGDRASVETPCATRILTWPIDDRPLLRGFNSGAPTLTTADGTRLWSPDDALDHDGILLDGPVCTVVLGRDGTVTVHDASLSEELRADLAA